MLPTTRDRGQTLMSAKAHDDLVFPSVLGIAQVSAKTVSLHAFIGYNSCTPTAA